MTMNKALERFGLTADDMNNPYTKLFLFNLTVTTAKVLKIAEMDDNQDDEFIKKYTEDLEAIKLLLVGHITLN